MTGAWTITLICDLDPHVDTWTPGVDRLEDLDALGRGCPAAGSRSSPGTPACRATPADPPYPPAGIRSQAGQHRHHSTQTRPHERDGGFNGAGPESDLSEEPVFGVLAGRAGHLSRPRVSFRACRHVVYVRDQSPVDDVGQAAFQASHRLVMSDAAGAARPALARTVEYAQIREQFGRPIGSFKAYKHRSATAFVDLKLAQSVAFRAANSDSFESASRYALASAIEATASATRVCMYAIQLHSGIAYSWESGLHRYLRRSRADEI